ncbi:MAG: RNA polymerase sigma factor [Pirellulaceae bacterium]
MSDPVNEPMQLVEHFFRHESAGLVAVLAKKFGFELIDVIEDMVQEAMLQALRTWRLRGIPANPSAWLHRVARNRVIDDLRRQRTHADSIDLGTLTEASADPLAIDPEAVEDSLLRMIFTCCHPSLDRNSQLALTLKVVCGLGDQEVARALLISPAAAKKRVTRAKRRLQLNHVQMELPAQSLLSERLDAVHETLYLMFNEGYSATTGDRLLRIDLCEEAARVCHMLCTGEIGLPTTRALLALMLFHAARFEARMDSNGTTIPLELQDRRQWDYGMMQVADKWLERSAEGDEVSRYHLEAGIARIHCRAPSTDETNWEAILKHYDRLLEHFPSPMHELNRAIVLGRLGREQMAFESLQRIEESQILEMYPLLHCAFGDLFSRTGKLAEAKQHWQKAMQLVASDHERKFIETKLEELQRAISAKKPADQP